MLNFTLVASSYTKYWFTAINACINPNGNHIISLYIFKYICYFHFQIILSIINTLSKGKSLSVY